MNTALLLIDIQNDYFPGGKNPLEGSLEASLQAKAVLEYFRAAKFPAIHIQHISTRPGATFFLPNTEGVEIHENVRPLPGETVIQKHYPNSFRETALLDYLRKEGITRLVIAGMMTHMCVEAGTRAAADLGFECTVLSDACATKALTFEGEVIPAEQVHVACLASLAAAYAKVMRVDELLAKMGTV
jgi:nicotinamidase-related amidase